MTADVSSLVDALGDAPTDTVTTNPVVLENYRADWTRQPDAGTPIAVARPRTAEQVATVVGWANQNGVPVVPRGAGTGLSGGSSAVDGGIVLSLERMTAIEIDPDTRVAIVEPGALNAAVKQAAADAGLWYPPDPSSFEICSIGGNIATNAGGLCCVKYGVTSDYVLGLDVVLADGRLIRLGGPRIKDVAGLSLVKLMVGSEGTLGVVTRAVLRLLPPQPPRGTLIATFPTMAAASAAVVRICATLRPALLELMDNATITAVESWRSHGLDTSIGALLIAQSDAPGEAQALELATIEAACADPLDLAATSDPEEAELFLAARRAALTALEARGSILLEDVGVPIPRLPELLDGIAAIAAEDDVPIAVVAHAGDGNTHPIISYDASDPGSTARAYAAFDRVMALAISLDGTITGEHGVGRSKKAALPDQLGPEVMALTRAIKATFDPNGILNPGVIL